VETVQIGDLVLMVAPEAVVDPDEGSHSVSKPKEKARPRKAVFQSKLILANAKINGTENVRIVGKGGLIDRPINTNGWLVMPIEMYKGIIPRAGMEIAENLTKGIPIKGFLIADDTRSIEPRRQEATVLKPKISPNWRKIASGAGKVAAAIAVGGAIISFFPLVLGIGAIGVALSYDPLLIAVTAEDEWVCLYQWWD
jgi:hypothetical protein